MKRTLLILVTTLVMTNVGIAQKTVNVYQDCSKNGKTVDVRIEGSECGHAWVDLGLSVRWATMNIGANTVEELGDKFAWGEIETKSDFSYYKYYTSSVGYTKYKADGVNLYSEDDAAVQNWGGNWRMPTKAEICELNDNCSKTYKTINNVFVCEFKSNVNGKSIIFPVMILSAVPAYGLYWSSTSYWYESLNTYTGAAYGLYFVGRGTNRYGGTDDIPLYSSPQYYESRVGYYVNISYGGNSANMAYLNRGLGALIRPVCKK